jgi:CheY-like chemotaxis protein
VLVDVVGPLEGHGAPPAAPPLGRILVVDDNADMRDYLGRLLHPQWHVALAADGVAALAAAQRLRPEVILTDVMLPGLDGFALLERVRTDPALQHTPVVLLSARAGDEAAIQGLRAGADDYIAKPFSPRELVARLRTVVERAQAAAALRENEAWLTGQKEAFQMAIDGAPLEASLDILLRTATARAGEGVRAAFYIVDADGTCLHPVSATGGMPASYLCQVDGFQIGADSLACGLAVASGIPIITRDVCEEPRWAPWWPLARAFDFRGCWSFPSPRVRATPWAPSRCIIGSRATQHRTTWHSPMRSRKLLPSSLPGIPRRRNANAPSTPSRPISTPHGCCTSWRHDASWKAISRRSPSR